jgi:predicted ATP-grasp superfamily ATP-dependent carboligase
VRVFAFEFFSGGGLAGQPLPASLAREGDLMLTTLVGELAELPGVEVIATRDPRLPPIPGCEMLRPRRDEHPLALYRRALAAADAAWPTASEAGGTLERLAQATLDTGRVLLGCRPDAVRLTASKRATAAALHERGLPVVPTFALPGAIPAIAGPWVVKPDDGAGCEDTDVVEGSGAAIVRLAANPGRLVAQPWIDGEPLSLSLVCADGASRLLACNRQVIAVRDGRVGLEAVQVNAVRDGDGRLARLAERVAAAVPGLWGYVGVDLVLTADGPVVLEINPRLTTSYCGLRPALGVNTAGLVLGLLRPSRGPLLAGDAWDVTTGASVEIRTEPSHAS